MPRFTPDGKILSVTCAERTPSSSKLGEVTALVAGAGCDVAAQAAAKIAGVSKVLTAKRFIQQAKLEELIGHIESVAEVVWLDDVRIGVIEIDGPFRPYTITIPPQIVSDDPIELRLNSVLWNPARVLGSPDDRELGVMIDRVTVR